MKEKLDLDEKNIKTAAPGDTLWDAKVKGLHLRAFAERKFFYLYFRTKTGKQRNPKLGDHGSITLAQAREAAKAMLTQVAAGRDPVAERTVAKNAPTMTKLWDRYRADRGAAKKSAGEDERIWEKYLVRFHKMTVADVTYEDVAKSFTSLKTTPIMANRTVALLSTLFNFAVAPLRWIEKNPTAGLVLNRETKRRRYLTPLEAVEIGKRLAAEAENNPGSVAFLWLLILTGARKGEIAKARWADLKGNKLVLAVHKTDQSGKDRVIQLCPEAMDVIDRLPRVLGGTIVGVLNPKKLWDKIRTDAGCPDLRMHDLRHSFASEALSLGYNLAQTGELLDHSSAETTKRYAHLVDEAASSAARKIGAAIVARMKVS